MRQKRQAAAAAAPKTVRPRGLAAAMGAYDARLDLSAYSNVPDKKPSPSVSVSSPSSGDEANNQNPTNSYAAATCQKASSSNIARSGSSTDDASTLNNSNSSSDDAGSPASNTKKDTAAATMAELSTALQERLGYSLEIKPSRET